MYYISLDYPSSIARQRYCNYIIRTPSPLDHSSDFFEQITMSLLSYVHPYIYYLTQIFE